MFLMIFLCFIKFCLFFFCFFSCFCLFVFKEKEKRQGMELYGWEGWKNLGGD